MKGQLPDDFHGFFSGGQTWYVGHLPGRKSVALYRVQGKRLDVAAFFRSEELARDFLWWLDGVTGLAA